eukprot:GAFH01000767.1.p2 GENE.GAFH01000767.1~~GAFH01000767.1.p2  ORF type:complete len:983 (+),score=424.58 GAFH01000767.1:28-2976(+)
MMQQPVSVAVFSVHYSTQWKESVFLCGSIPELGAWDVSRAVPLATHGGVFWSLDIALPLNQSFEYKYLVRKEGESWINWEPGMNHHCHLACTRGELVEIRDSWNVALDFTGEAAQSAALRLIMARANPRPLTPLNVRGNHIVAQLEVCVPFLNPNEQVGVIGESGNRRFWVPSAALMTSDADAPIHKIRIELDPAELPLRYKYVIIHPSEPSLNVTEPDAPRVLHAPVDWDEVPAEATVYGPGAQPMTHAQARQAGFLQPNIKTAQFVVRHDGSFKYPNPPHWRAAGMAIPVFSIRTEKSVGVGEFADLPLMAEFCHRAGLRMLQLLPITDTMVNGVHWTDSYPYSSVSNFALHPIYTCLEKCAPLPAEVVPLIAQTRGRLNGLPQVDYPQTLEAKMNMLQQIYRHHHTLGLLNHDPEFERFLADSQYWLPSYACFKVLADQNGGTNWTRWPRELQEEAAVPELVRAMCQPAHPSYPEVRFYMWLQFHLDKQLREASAECAALRVALKGDVPIGVDPNSADTWYFRKYFNIGTQSGAPPDAFSMHGQNWAFPTYNWDAIVADKFVWWATRLHVMGRSFHAYRIDHILGFFRIWEIPPSARSGMHARFNPGQGIHRSWLEAHGIVDRHGRLTAPYITRWLIETQFGEETDAIIAQFMERSRGDGEFQFKAEFATEDKIAAFEEARLHITLDSTPAQLKEFDVRLKKFWVLTNSVCLYQDEHNPDVFYPRFGITNSLSWQTLGPDWKAHLERFSIDYFYRWHDETWRFSAHKKFPHLRAASRMLVCGEDLGLLAPCVSPIMSQYKLLGLRVQRMPADPKVTFIHPNNYEYGTVATTSTHDMPPLRAWWRVMDQRNFRSQEEMYNSEAYRKEIAKIDQFWYDPAFLGNHNPRPRDLPPSELERIVDMHMFCPAMLAIFPLQDLLALLPSGLYHPEPFDELINNPDNRKHYWRYRMRCTVEELLRDADIIDRIRGKVASSGRLSDH